MYLLIAKTDKTLAKKTSQEIIDKIKSLHYHKEDYKIYVSSGSNDYMGPQTKNQAETLALHYHYFDRHNLSYHQWQGRHHDFRQSYPYLYYGIRSFYWCTCFHE